LERKKRRKKKDESQQKEGKEKSALNVDKPVFCTRVGGAMNCTGTSVANLGPLCH
jgi:hypothetical protein